MTTDWVLLSACPVLPGSVHVYLNGIEQRENVDWVYANPAPGVCGIEILPPMAVLAGDKVEVLYATAGAGA